MAPDTTKSVGEILTGYTGGGLHLRLKEARVNVHYEKDYRGAHVAFDAWPHVHFFVSPAELQFVLDQIKTFEEP